VYRLREFEDFLDSAPYVFPRDAQLCERLSGHTLPLIKKAKEDVLGAEEAKTEEMGLLLGMNQDTAGTVGETLEHRL